MNQDQGFRVNGLLSALVAALLLLNLTGFGEGSPIRRLSVAAIGTIVWLAIEIFSRKIQRVQDIWHVLISGEMGMTRTIVSGVVFFGSLYMLLTAPAHPVMPDTLGNIAIIWGTFLGLWWFGFELAFMFIRHNEAKQPLEERIDRLY